MPLSYSFQFEFTVENSPRFFPAPFKSYNNVLESSRSGISFVNDDQTCMCLNIAVAQRKMQTVENNNSNEEQNEMNDSDERRMHVAHAIHATI